MAEGSASWRLAAPAKLNLWLAVVGRRADGYHELDSLLVLLDLADELSFAPGPPALRVGGPAAAGVPEDRTNLAWRGWVAGLGAEPTDGRIFVEKRIPATAGLGGGSSDAAAAWRLARWSHGRVDDRPTPSELGHLAAVGADIPFFAAQFAVARVTGVGEQVEPLFEPPATREVVLVHPPFALATSAVFAELRRVEWSGPVAEAASVGGAALTPGRNDLEHAARRLRPELEGIFRVVVGAGGEPHLAGSGPTVFTLTDDPERAAGIAARLERAGLAASRTRLSSEPASIEPWTTPGP